MPLYRKPLIPCVYFAFKNGWWILVIDGRESFFLLQKQHICQFVEYNPQSKLWISGDGHSIRLDATDPYHVSNIPISHNLFGTFCKCLWLAVPLLKRFSLLSPCHYKQLTSAVPQHAISS